MNTPTPPILTPDMVLKAYAQGYFPMASNEDPDEIHWFNPPHRAVLPIQAVKISRSLHQLLKKKPFEIKVDTAFDQVIEACATATPERPSTWINDEITNIFKTLHRAGFAHSVECWQGDSLVGGLYGLTLGSAFCGESMFSRVSGASKIALIHLCARLDSAGFTLLDCQLLNDYTAQFGAYEIPKATYLEQLSIAIQQPGNFPLKGLKGAESSIIDDFLKKALTIS